MRSLLSRTRKQTAAPTVEDFGLDASKLQCNGVALGFLPEYGKTNASTINARLPKSMAIVGDFVQISDTDMAMKQIDWHLQDVLETGAVWSIALMPQSGLSSFNEDTAHRIALKMAEVNRKGITVWLRFAHEMNGDWYAYGRKSKDFIKAWQVLTDTVRAQTNKTFMLWAPNVSSSAHGKGGYKEYWPGASYVDICGLSIYVYDDANNPVQPRSFQSRFDDFYKLYALGEGKPITIAETSVPYRYKVDSEIPLPGAGREVEMKLDWLEQVIGADTAKRYPMLHSVCWFDIAKSEDGHFKDFRAILGRPDVADAMIAAIRSMSSNS